MRSVLVVFLCAQLVAGADPALTIYNQNFAVVRENVPVVWNSGISEIRYSGATAHVEPASVVLRDPSGKQTFQILEQNYRNDPVSQALLLSMFEGQTIEFRTKNWSEGGATVRGKIVRSGYVPHTNAFQRYGQQYMTTQYAMASGGAGEPLIEVEGKLFFGLPGQPVFPTLGENTILKPTLTWKLRAPAPGKADAELSYVSGGLRWEADYNVVGNERDNWVDLIGWVTMDNQSGKTFENARVQLMAGDVRKQQQSPYTGSGLARTSADMRGAQPPVTERSFDEYHLYTLDNPTTLRDRETKQVEFVRAGGVQANLLYIYEGAYVDPNRYGGWNYEMIRNDPQYGIQSNNKVWIMREFENTKANGLGMPLPKGRLRFYTRDNAGRTQFIGENNIDHTAQGEKVRVYTGNAFDIVGERRRLDYKIDHQKRMSDESFEIKLRNRKKTAVEVRAVERLYRSANWSINVTSDPFDKLEANTVEFRTNLSPDQEKIITYTVHYTW